jgi:hypothetical protein
MIYKVNYVVIDSEHAGAIVNVDEPPLIGDTVVLGRLTCQIIEVVELMPPRGEFNFLHATCRPMEKTRSG